MNAQARPFSSVIKAAEFSSVIDARSILEKAQEKQSQIHTAYENALEQARREGFQAGREEGIRSVATELSGAVETSRKELADLEPSVIEIVLRATMLILADMQPEERLRRLVQRAIGETKGARKVTLKVNAGEQEMVRQAISGLEHNIEVKAGDYMNPGEMVLETETTRTQIGLADQIATMLEAIHHG